MPVFTINTNVSQVPSDFKNKAANAVAATLGKPLSYVAVQINSGQNISFGGTEKPVALCELMSIGALSTSSNKKHANTLMTLLEKELGISPSRTYITFTDADKANIGFNKTTFHDLI